MAKKGSVKTPPPKPQANPNYPSTTEKPSGGDKKYKLVANRN